MSGIPEYSVLEAWDTHLTRAESSGGPPPALLFVVNYPANTGYAWDNIERSFARVASRLAERSVRTLVAYPSIEAPPDTLNGSPVEAVELDATLASTASLSATIRFVQRNNVRVLYLTDRPAWSWKYAVLRRASGCSIVVHDRTSGARTVPRGARRALKGLAVRLPGALADVVIAVSEFVRRRQIEVGLVPEDRVVRVYNGFAVDSGPGEADRGEPRSGSEAAAEGTHATFGIDPQRPIVACASRASPVKGVDVLLQAFDRVAVSLTGNQTRPVLIYLGDGPQLADIEKLRESLDSADSIVLGGYRSGAVRLLRDASVFVVPSRWQDAFPSSVLEPMALGKPVVATDVGGIPEMIESGVSGILVPAGDIERMAAAIEALLADPARATEIGTAARRRIAERFTPEGHVESLVELFEARTGLLSSGSRASPNTN